MNTKSIIFLLFQIATVLNAAPSAKQNAVFDLKILFNNDMHARFEQTDTLGGTCREADLNNNRCYGGFARVAHLVRQERQLSKENGTPFLYLNAGDTYSGTPWFTLFTYNITTEFLNILQPDAITLGNHEFNNGIAELEPFVTNAHFPILVANLDFSKVPSLADSKNIQKSHVFEWNGVKVGIIGYLTPDTIDLAKTEEVIFVDEISAINEEAAKLQAQGVNIIIGLGHSGITMDQKIAAECPLVDLIIGGHSHTFLYTGDPPNSDRPMGPYPIVVQQPSGKQVPVVQAFAFTKYLGSLQLQFDSIGDLISWDGSPILLDANVPADSDVLEVLEEYRFGIIELQNAVVGKSLVYLDGLCRRGECNLGNFLTDAMVYEYALTYTAPNSWTDASVAILQGGAIRQSIDASLQEGNITRWDLNTVLPFQNNIFIVEVSGQNIVDALERSVERYNSDPWGFGEFLQFSGLHVQFNLLKPPGQRVVNVEIQCALCAIPSYGPLDVAGAYKVIMTDFTYFGGDGYNMFADNPYRIFDFNDIDLTANHVTRMTPIYPAIDSRIILENAPEPEDTDDDDAAATIQFSFSLLLILWIIRFYQ